MFITKLPSESLGNDIHTIKLDYINLGNNFTTKQFFEAIKELDNDELNSYLRSNIDNADDIIFISSGNFPPIEFYISAVDMFDFI